MGAPAIKSAAEGGPTELPDPCGWHILIGLPEADEKTDGGIIKTDDYRHVEQVASVVGFVMKMGPLCYKDKDKFPSGPWCKEGDFVFIPPFSGVRLFHKSGIELRLINDDTVQAVVDDPRGWRRA
jgi:co-chaperonin GroES (HSP10)|tara:strand:+ start:8738 stop:9112 length:375 start_codon:yes stop_codon:yes gene_type:complete